MCSVRARPYPLLLRRRGFPASASRPSSLAKTPSEAPWLDSAQFVPCSPLRRALSLLSPMALSPRSASGSGTVPSSLAIAPMSARACSAAVSSRLPAALVLAAAPSRSPFPASSSLLAASYRAPISRARAPGRIAGPRTRPSFAA
ncbi:uncharacterized protein LOC100192508 [Zea mays]|uniref:Uncharacterized protein n=1 Tax=Zea mays TaxID=4577 RepID=B4FBL7_MAIZE|nr:uncharacterized protein LOC100192508 [Zea mays]ACF79510.1 unknown [Zea mays]|eukprot:NP_001131200.1 uncharacterized protein LOC100192508 [Zea mays]